MIDWSKPVQTRDGRKVRVLCTDRIGAYPVVGLLDEVGTEGIKTWATDGVCLRGCDHELDIINTPERVERWKNLYPLNSTQVGASYASKDAAISSRGADACGLERITYEDGKPVAVALEDV